MISIKDIQFATTLLDHAVGEVYMSDHDCKIADKGTCQACEDCLTLHNALQTIYKFLLTHHDK